MADKVYVICYSFTVRTPRQVAGENDVQSFRTG